MNSYSHGYNRHSGYGNSYGNTYGTQSAYSGYSGGAFQPNYYSAYAGYVPGLNTGLYS